MRLHMNQRNCAVSSYQQAYPDSLVQLQQEYCAPIVRWIQDYFDVTLSVTKELIGVPHPEETIARLRKEVEGMEPLSLAGDDSRKIFPHCFGAREASGVGENGLQSFSRRSHVADHVLGRGRQ
ncbi:MAG: hypothetical protein BJ554DRAFT_7472 [Olpidium bornovanus]|uniref:Uncharacterized protein n=1 Tax=Olpidium bornovanus TaxID=278681 RepID=A0A8H8DJU7_9FUNG|nr:MAG: hypothetical protein BJ554DRAFT_7472 [Olpidium bornovanus]